MIPLRGYLLDTNIITYWFDHDDPRHAQVLGHIGALLPDTPLRISSVTLGEIEYGLRADPRTDTALRAGLTAFVKEELPPALDVRNTTAIYYGPLRARLFDKFPPKKRRRKGLRPEQLTDPITAKELGIQENDLWLAAQAIEHRLVFVTHDKMDHIRQVLDGELALDIEDWAD